MTICITILQYRTELKQDTVFQGMMRMTYKQPPTLHLLTDLALVDGDDWAWTLRRLEALRDECGELCDTRKPVNHGDFLGTVTAKVG